MPARVRPAASLLCRDQWADDRDLGYAPAPPLPAINLEDALGVALLVIEHEPHNAERTGVRWIGRLCLERREMTLAQHERGGSLEEG